MTVPSTGADGPGQDVRMRIVDLTPVERYAAVAALRPCLDVDLDRRIAVLRLGGFVTP